MIPALYRRGLARLAIVLLIPWALGWSVVVYRQAEKTAAAESRLDFWVRAAASPEGAAWESLGPDRQGALLSANQVRDEVLKQTEALRNADRRLRSIAIGIGFGAPAILFLATVAGFWAWRGFKPRSP